MDFPPAGLRNKPVGAGGAPPNANRSFGDVPLRRIPDNASVGVRRPRSRAGSGALRYLQYVFLLIGLASAGYCAWFYGEGRLLQAYDNWRFEQIVRHRTASIEEFLGRYLARIPYLGARLRAAHPSGDLTLPAPAGKPQIRLPEGALIGRLEIPRLGLSDIVLEGDSDAVLREGLGHVPGTSLPGARGNVAVAGHRDTFFRALKDVHKDDTIVLATTGGAYRYKVLSTQIVTPTDTKVLAASGRPSLTLVTCYPFYFVGSAPERFIVRAQQLGRAPVRRQDAPAMTASAVTTPPRLVKASYRSHHAAGVHRAPLHAAGAAAGHPHRAVARVTNGSAHDDADEAGSANEAAETLLPLSDQRRHGGTVSKATGRVVSWFKSLSSRIAGKN